MVKNHSKNNWKASFLQIGRNYERKYFKNNEKKLYVWNSNNIISCLNNNGNTIL